MAETIKIKKDTKIGQPLYEIESTPAGRRKLERTENTPPSDFDLAMGKGNSQRAIRKPINLP